MTKVTLRHRPVAWTIGVAAAACATAAAAKNWGEWGPPANLESLPGSSLAVNTPAVDGCASLSADRLTIMFSSNRGGNFDLYMATRDDQSDGFGVPVALPAAVNTAANEACPTIANGKQLYFSSDREDPAYDIYVTRLERNGWSAPENLGSDVNRPGWLDETPTFYEDDDGNDVMLFSSRLPNGAAGKIYQSVNGGAATLVAGGVQSAASDNRPSVTRDGRTVYFDSTRPGGLGGPDLYTATRSRTDEPFGAAVHLASLSSAAFDARPSISKDGSLLTFSSARAGSESAAPDTWFATRDRLSDDDDN